MRLKIPSFGVSVDIPFWVSVDTFLDEELDSSPISVENSSISKPFPRFTPAVLEVDGEPPTYWLIGSDSVYTAPNGLSQHTVQLIEPTKWLERFMVGNKTVTQPLYVEYLTSQVTPSEVRTEENEQAPWLAKLRSNKEISFAYYSPMPNTNFPIWPPFCFEGISDRIETMTPEAVHSILEECTVECQETGFNYSKSVLFEKSKGEKIPDAWEDTEPIERIAVSDGVIVVTYKIFIQYYGVGTDIGLKDSFAGSYTLAAVAPQAGKERTLKDAALSMIYAAESLNASETPTFKLNDALAAYLDTITAPEITVTGATLREALDEIAKYVGAITRLDLVPEGEGFSYEINFEKYCKDTVADTSEFGDPVNGITRTVSCEDYCTALDSTAANIVNYSKGGPISDPSPQLFRTPRSEDASYRVTEGSAKIITAFPIERVDGLTCRIYKDGVAYDFDLFPYLFESTEYGALSSYEPTYPFSKAYALSYTLGQRSIGGLDFTVPNPVHPIFESPAIVNILNREIEAHNGADEKYEALSAFDNTNNILNFTKLLFRVTYVPTGSLRVRMRKPSSFGKPESVLAYNQSAAKLDAKAFGRSMFGAALRMGNEITTYQYAPPIGAKVPQKGERFGEDGYISEVHVEYGLTYKKVTLEISEGFNRLSQFVGVNKSQRIFEISERMSLDRHIVYEDFCLIGTKKRQGRGALVSGNDTFLEYLRKAFTDTSPKLPNTPFIVAQGIDEGENELAPCMLPALCYGAGNALTFTACFEDNFGAGKRVDSRKDKEGDYEYYATESDVRYTDLFGRVKKLRFSVVDKVNTDEKGEEFFYDIADSLPKKVNRADLVSNANIVNTNTTPLIIDKDAREAIKSLTYQVSFLEADGVRISPFFSENLPLAQSPSRIVFTPITAPINNMTEEVQYLDRALVVDVEKTEQSYPEGLVSISVKASKLPENCVGWAAVAYDKKAADAGGKMRFLFGQNCELTAGQELSVHFTFFRKNNIKQEET